MLNKNKTIEKIEIKSGEGDKTSDKLSHDTIIEINSNTKKVIDINNGLIKLQSDIIPNNGEFINFDEGGIASRNEDALWQIDQLTFEIKNNTKHN